MALSRLLLKNNRDTDQNACFCNSILQILRRMEKFKTMILTESSENVIHKELHNILIEAMIQFKTLDAEEIELLLTKKTLDAVQVK